MLIQDAGGNMVKVLIFFSVVIVIGVIVLTVLVVTKPDIFSKNKNKSGEVISADNTSYNKTMDEQEIGDTKVFNPVKSFEDYAMNLGHHNYRAIIEVSSVNYMLMSENEQDMVEESYKNFLNSLNFPVEIYIQTREIDLNLMIDSLTSKVSKTLKKFDKIASYADEYIQNMMQIPQYINNSKVKKKYIIVPFNNTDLMDMSELTNSEIKTFALEELYNRCSIVISGLNGVGLTANMLDKPAIAECLYSYYHRDFYRIARDFVDGMFDSLAINSSDNKMPNNRMTLDRILYVCQNQIRENLVTSDLSEEEIAFYKYIIDILEYFKQDDRSSSIADLIFDCQMHNDDSCIKYAEQHPDNMIYSNFDIPDERNNVSIRYFPDEVSSDMYAQQQEVDSYSGYAAGQTVYNFEE